MNMYLRELLKKGDTSAVKILQKYGIIDENFKPMYNPLGELSKEGYVELKRLMGNDIQEHTGVAYLHVEKLGKGEIILTRRFKENTQ